LFNILLEFAVPMKQVRPIKMCLSETCSKIRIGIHTRYHEEKTETLLNAVKRLV
jgi:hypothetical protein